MKVENKSCVCWLNGEDLVFVDDSLAKSLHEMNSSGWELIQIVPIREKSSDIPKTIAIFKFVGE